MVTLEKQNICSIANREGTMKQLIDLLEECESNGVLIDFSIEEKNFFLDTCFVLSEYSLDDGNSLTLEMTFGEKAPETSISIRYKSFFIHHYDQDGETVCKFYLNERGTKAITLVIPDVAS